MKRLSLLIALFCTLAIGATIVTSETKQKKMPKTVQGIDYVSTLPDDGRRAAASSDYPEDPDDLTTPEGDFTFDKIESWTGEGENQAALVIQWNDPKETAALVFGYRWSGTATGADMIRAVVAANPQLYGLIQYTNVSSPTDPDGGYTINGFGWDNDNDGDIALIDTGHDNEEYTSETGLFIHPRGYVPGQGGSSDYDYDNWKARDADDFWGAGWYISYWSYWVKDTQEANFSYSGWGASGRVLQNGSWDGWNFSLNMMPSDWKNFKAAPSPMPDDAKKEFKADGIYYVLLDFNKKTVAVAAPHEMEGETLTAYTGDIEVPATFEDGGMTYTVTAIGNEAFMNSSVTAVTLPESVVKIGKSAFENSTLRTLSKRSADATVASTGTDRFDNITSIGASAFKNCSLFKNIFYPAGIKKLESSVFEGTAVEEVSVPLHVEAIGESTFASCPQLTKVVLPKTLKAIGDKAFAGCDAISTIRCESTIPVAITDETFGTATYQNAGIEVPSGYTDTYKAAAGWKNFARYTEFILPVNAGDRFIVNGISYRVTSASDVANNVCVTYMPIEGNSNRDNLKTANAAYGGDIVIPAQVEYQNVKFDVTEVNDSAFFEAAAITSLTFPDRITRIGNNVCYDCTGIESLTLPASLKEIGDYAFAYNSKLTGVTLPEGLETLGLRAFMSCAALKQAVLPATIKKIDNYAFYGCGLETIALPDGVDTIGTNVFQSCRSLVSAKLPATLKAVPNYMFSSCPALTTVGNMENVTEIKASAFEGCTSLKMDIPAGVTALGTSAFKNCKAIESITIPSAIKSIPNSLLEGCTALKTVTMAADVETFGNSLFSGCTNLSALVYAGGETAAETTDGSDGNVITLPASLKEIGNYCFNKCTAIAGFNLNDGLTKIGNYAFADNANLKAIRLPETVTSIGNYAFRATGLTELVLPAGVTYLGNYIAQNCTGITFYNCNPKPISCSGTTFSPSGYNGTSTIVVPTGSKSAYEAANNWKKNTIVEPAANALTIGGEIVTKLENGTTTAALPYSFGYDMGNLPAQFAAANDGVVAATSTFTLNYKDGDSEAVTVAPIFSDGILLISGLALEKGREYTAALTATMADGMTTLTSNDFTLTRGKAARPEKVKVWLGEGPDHAEVIMRFNDGKGVENIAVGVNFTAPATVQSVMETIVRNDRRFYALMKDGKFTGYGFDLNGDSIIGLTADAPLTGENGIFTTTSDAAATPEQAYDHWAQNTADTVWKAFSAEDYGTAFAACENVTADDVLLLEYTAADAPATTDYVAYIDTEDKVGAWVPEGLSVTIADEAYLPAIVNVGAGKALSSISSNRTDAEGNKLDGIVTKLMFTNPRTGNTMGQLSFGSATGTVYISLKPNISGVKTDYSEPVAVEILAPETAITSLEFAEPVYEARLTEAFTPALTVGPEDATYTKLTYTTSDNTVATVSSTGKVTATSKAGTAIITATYDYNPEIKAEMTVNVALRNPVTGIDIEGATGDSIVLNPKHLIGLIGQFTPENADIREFDVTLEGNGTGKDDYIATMYAVNYWDEDNNRIRFNELSGHRQGECKLILKAKDGSGYTREYKVKVQDQDRTPVAENTYLDGTIILNEEWFGHTNGGMNFVTKDKQMMYQVYERENPGMSFGCTSQYGTIWNGKLLVASKQAADGGDPLPGGGRLVVADAKTFKRIGSIDEIRLETEGRSGDGRAIAGATPDKAYMGTNQGIYIIDLNDIKVTGKIGTGDAVNADLYSGQIGDMVHAGNYVFAIKQKTGTFIIDVNTDEVVKTIEDADVQGVTQSADGNVWIATLDGKASKFVCIDPATLEERAELTTVMPEEIGAVTCGWGAWRTTQFFGCNSKNVLWFSPGSSVSNGGAGAFYSWEIGTDPTNIKPVFDLKNPVLPSHNRNVAQATYGTSRYDDRSGELIVMTTEYKASGHYRYNWTHFVNPTTGEITKTIDLEPYYWFQAVPIFPDKEEPKLAEGFNGVEFDVTDSAFDTAQAEEIDLAALVSDADNNDYNITFALPAETETAENGTTTGDTGTETATGAVEYSLDGTILTVKPAAYGSTVVNVNATSNGRVSTIAIPVTVGGTNAIGNATNGTRGLRADVNRIVISGCKGTVFTVCNAAGAVMTQFTADSDEFVARFNFRSGVYIISGNGTSVKFAVK